MNSNLFTPLNEKDFNLIAYQFDADSLTLARELRGYTKAELADAIGKTSGAISQFEHSIIKPDAITVMSLSMALGVPANFFTRGFNNTPIAVENCHFRSLRSTSQKSRKQILASAKILRNLIEILEEEIDFPQEKISRTAKEIGGYEDIERYATQVRKLWGYGLGPIPELIPILEDKGIIVSFISYENKQVDAFSFWHSARPFVFLVPGKYSSSRCRLDCAHELGHLLMHADVSSGNKELEAQADRFAGAFLVPRDSFIKECPRRLDWDAFYELKRRWKISLAALIRRAYDLECISEASYRRAFMYLNQSGMRFSEPDEPKQEIPTLIEQALDYYLEDYTVDDITSRLSIRPHELEKIIKVSKGEFDSE